MPEGDTIYNTAVTLRKALLGRGIARFESSVPEVAAAAARHRVEGRRVGSVEPHGKHLVIAFDPAEGPPAEAPPAEPVYLHTHMRMIGSWHVYRPRESWWKPARLAKVVLHTDAFVAPCFNAPVVELLTEWQLHRHPSLSALGPDAIADDFDADEAARRVLSRPGVEIGVALLDQRLFSGVGNIYKSEVLFLRRISPFAAVGELTAEEVSGLIAESRRLLRLNRNRGERRTLSRLDDRQRLWVYGRAGEPCRVCRTPICVRRQGIDARTTYYCPVCQGAPAR